MVIILVHGAWHGSWSWCKVAPHLQAKGYTVITPDLPGHGQTCLSFEGITLTTYVDFLKDLITVQLEPVCLVGHSLGGTLISQVAEHIPDKIAQLIFVTSLLPTDQRSCVQEASTQSLNFVSELLTSNVKTNEMYCSLEEPSKIKNAFYHCCTDEDFEFALQHLQIEPLAPMLSTIQITSKNFGSVKKCFIVCTKDKAVEPSNQLRMASNANITDLIHLDCDHSPFFSMPEALAEAIASRVIKL